MPYRPFIRSLALALIFAGTAFNCEPSPAFASWQKPAQPPAIGPLTALLVHPLESGKIITASGHQIFSKAPAGTWEYFSHDSAAPIRKLLYLKEAPRDFFILTEKSVSRCNLKTRRCSEIYRASQFRGNSVLAFAIAPEDREHWFIGTEKGLFESDDSGKTWFGFGNLKKPVSLLRFWKDRFFLAAGGTLYASEDRAHFDSVFSLQSPEGETLSENEDAFPEDGEDNAIGSPLYYDLLLPNHASHPFWLATREGIFESRDEGKSWKALPESGLRSIEIRSLAWSEKTRKLFAGTSKGVYAWLPRHSKWQELYQGLENENILGLALLKGESETLLTLSPAGFFSSILLPDQIHLPGEREIALDQNTLFQELLRLEPTAQDIQKAAIRYANVRNSKIKRWHTASRFGGLLPTFSVGKDFSQTPSIDIDRGGTSDKDTYIQGPDYQRQAWDMSVSWHLSDLLYSSAQTSIDSREKLMVELRNDILSEVTRIYYERRRLELEILFHPATSQQDHLEKLLRLDELTSLLDGMTTGYFSKKLEEIYARQPDLKNLWQWSHE